MAIKIKKKLKQEKTRSYLNKDFDGFRSNLLDYSRTYFSENIQDFSEASMGGLLLEMAAYVGDTMSYYLDHQFNELDIRTAVEDQNIERLITQSGVKITGATPSLVEIAFYIKVVSEASGVDYVPKSSHLPIIRKGTILTSQTGVTFELVEDINFSDKDVDGNLLGSPEATDYVAMFDGSWSKPGAFILKRYGTCTSGTTYSETFNISTHFIPFRTITLGTENVSEIISILDSDDNEYYEVESLSQDTVFRRLINLDPDSGIVPETLEVMPAPRRFISATDRKTNLTTIRFGSGQAETLDDDIVPDPSEFAIPLFGDRRTFSRAVIDPNSLLRTRTLGVSPVNTSITIRYRAGGGLSHNVSSNIIRTIKTLLIKFKDGVPLASKISIRASIDVKNEKDAIGGENAPTLNELRSIAQSFRNSQSRIVTRPDLISRIYAMPARFGRVFRIGIADNPDNPLASLVTIVSRDRKGKLITSPDALKINLRTYLNEYRLVSDAIDILDAQIINISVTYKVVVDATSNANLVIQDCNARLKQYLKIENFQIDQPLVVSDLSNIVLNAPGVLSLVEIRVENRSGLIDDLYYSDSYMNIEASTVNGIIIPDSGVILEVKYPDTDIIGNTV
tara:strand:- start:17741 stop:19603 length:1863 start_codon:yes stop_codon:yes gene_type:complete